MQVHLLQPRDELLFEILAVVEAADLEEAALHPADQILDRSLLIGPSRRAQLDAETVVHRHVSEGGVPLGGTVDLPITTVLGLSKTTRSGTPSKDAKPWSNARISDSTRSSGTVTTWVQREYFNREAKK